MSFNSIVEATIDEWDKQTKSVLENLFSGEDKHIRALTTLIKDGRLTAGKGNNKHSTILEITKRGGRQASLLLSGHTISMD